MFANLKNKLIEEVKASPSKFQQFAQAAVSSSSSSTPSGSDTTTTTTNENFFSITEEDTPQNSPFRPLRLQPNNNRQIRNVTPQNGTTTSTGAIPRARKLSNSSMASDVSFRLPSYDAPAVYHLQSDLESEIGSEMDESASTTKFDVITKEQLFAAYKRSLERYNKYRCRYTDLAKKYKDLERDSTKARSVLVETQEKAIRRINELREQCGLEQQAKAHLEEALRVEMDDMQCKIQAYQTKLKLLGENPESIIAKINESSTSQVNLIDIEESVPTMKATSENAAAKASPESLDQRIFDLEEQLKEREKQIKLMTESLETSRQEITILRKQEEDNALLLAQTKQAIHTELESKENEVKKLKETLKETQKSLEASLKKEGKLNEQVVELNELREKLKQTMLAKQEIDAKLIASEHMYGMLKEQVSSKEKDANKFEEKIAALTREHEQKLQDLRQQNVELNEMLQRQQQNEVSIAEIDNESNLTRTENINLKATIAERERTIKELQNEVDKQSQRISEVESKYNEIERQLAAEKQKGEEFAKQLDEESAKRTQNGQRVKQLESELRILNEQNANNESETVKALKHELQQTATDLNGEINALRETLASKEKELKSVANKMSKQKKQNESQLNKIKELSEELDRIRLESNEHVQQMEAVQKNAAEQQSRIENENESLKIQNAGLIKDFQEVEEQMHIFQTKQYELETEKHELESIIENLRKESRIQNDQIQKSSQELKDAEQNLKQVEVKMQNMQSENAQLAERNCLLEENALRIEKALTEREREQTADVVNTNALRSKLEAAEDAYSKLNEKMSQILDENSRMHNAQELMDHDHRTLQDKFDALEKEKLVLEDTQRCLIAELEDLKNEKDANEAKIIQMGLKLKELTAQVLEQQQRADALDLERKNLCQEKADIELALSNLQKQSTEMQSKQTNDHQLTDQLQSAIVELKKKLEDQIQQNASTLSEKQEQLDELTSKFHEAESRCLRAEELSKELDALLAERDELKRTIESVTLEVKSKTESINELEEKLKETENMHVLQSEVENEREILLKKLNEQKSISENKQKELEILNANHLEIVEKLSTAEDEIRNVKLKEQQLEDSLENIKHEKEQMEITLNEQIKAANNDIEKLHENNIAFQNEIEELKNKNLLEIQNLETSFKDLQAENEKLQKIVTPESQQKLIEFDELMIENEFLNKNSKQLEEALKQQKDEYEKQSKEIESHQEKLKSIQCELYVLRENATMHAQEISIKEQESLSFRSIVEDLNTQLATERLELKRQNEHAQYLTQQNDDIQRELSKSQQQLSETTQALQTIQKELATLKVDSKEQLDKYENELENVRQKLQASESQSSELEALKVQLEEMKNLEKSQTNTTTSASPSSVSADNTSTKTKHIDHNSDMERLRKVNEQLQTELEDLRHRSSGEITSLQQEVEDLQNNGKQMAERIMELERLRAGLQAQKLFSTDVRSGGMLAAEISRSSDNDKGSDHNDNIDSDSARLAAEKAELEQKLKEIVNDVREVSDRNMFLEQKCENYLILEQSNERLKSQNAKLARQLDETLVSMQHNENITANTEFEYLRNIMFQYLTGSANGNNETLVKVISAVLKFSPQQTQVALEKEHQRRSLINKIL